MSSETGEQSIQWMKKILIGLGLIFVLTGLVLQWPVLGGSYRDFIEGKGYLSLMLGLIMIILGYSIRLLVGDDEED